MKDGEFNVDSVKVDATRTYTMSWCRCGYCEIMDSPRECVCCWELEQVHEIALSCNTACVTSIKAFEDVCLNRDVLETAIATRRIMLGKCPGDSNRGNPDFCRLAYSNFVHWIFKKSLGRNNRIVLPACVVTKIRKQFPNACDAPYIGFLHANEPYPS